MDKEKTKKIVKEACGKIAKNKMIESDKLVDLTKVEEN